MKIAFVNDTFLEGRGADTVIYEIARRLGKKHEVVIISSDSDFPEENFKIINIKGGKLLTGSTLRDSFSYIPNISKFRREVSRLNKQNRFEVLNIHHSSLNPAFLGSNEIPSVVTWYGSPLSRNGIRTMFNNFVLKSIRNREISITISNYLKDKLLRSAPKSEVKVVYCGVSEEFKPTYKDKGYMLFVGRLEEHKRIHEIIRLSKEVDCPLVLVGSGPLEKRLKNYAKRIDADKVRFSGKVSREELIKSYQECSFFVSSSKWEGFGLIFLEAAACAKPSIGYSAGSIPEVISEGKSGFVVNNFREFKEKAKILIKDKKLRVSMGKEALKFSKKFGWDRCVREYEKIFLEVKNGK
ncbi:MAG: glycosyltransferase family 4 protein [Nanoarchaeota archaeon]|nr:glycosyltransferase family 4 protein [Nanoarchaeota archaeon]